MEEGVHALAFNNYNFFAQRSEEFNKIGEIIPYTQGYGNFEFNKGIFRAPFHGSYYFYFSALKGNNQNYKSPLLTVKLVVDGVTALAEGSLRTIEGDDYFPVTMTAMLQLKTNSTVGIRLVEGSIEGKSPKEDFDQNYWTVFLGYLVQPDFAF